MLLPEFWRHGETRRASLSPFHWLAYGRESLRVSPCLSKVKVLLGALTDLNDRIDRNALRVRRPKHTVFLCGGVISEDTNQKSVLSIRDYLVRHRNIGKNVSADIVLAETAQQLYRDTNYPDLISFEEDVASIASIVLVISESPGSLAELGAFASEPIIREALRLIVSEKHNDDESFVRYGPVRRIENIDRERIGIFPWRNHKKNNFVVKRSIAPHYREVIRFINDKIEQIPDSHLYRTLGEERLFYDILWVISLFEAAPPDPLYQAVKVLHPHLHDDDIRKRLYILRTCRWIRSFSYAGRDFSYLQKNIDPYEYAFLPDRRVRDVAATRLAIATEFKDGAQLTPAILKRLAEKRREQS